MFNCIKKPKKMALTDNLNYLTVDILKIIAKTYDISGTYKMKKKELVEALYDKLTKKDDLLANLAAFYEFQDHTEEINRYEGTRRNAEENNLTMALGLSKIGVYYVYQDGEGATAIVPDEVQKVIESCGDKETAAYVARYSLVFKYLRAFNNLYGVFEMDFLIKTFNAQNSAEAELTKEELLNSLAKYNIFNSEIHLENDLFINEALFVVKGELEALMEGRKNKDYYIPSKEELLKYSNSYYINKNKYYAKLASHLSKICKDKSMVKDIILELYDDSQMDAFDMKEYLYSLQAYKVAINNIYELNTMIKLCMDFSNNTPKWVNRGWCPSELGKVVSDNDGAKAVHKVGRNDLCPCGSGKKYKKCCGR